mmetsp:Transcript_9385/g.16988  ORF Transcript_9385/g.16988 Transcript_9385/m.16988 type:complete len:402 (+) Transcript_9385:119-1324(+)
MAFPSAAGITAAANAAVAPACSCVKFVEDELARKWINIKVDACRERGGALIPPDIASRACEEILDRHGCQLAEKLLKDPSPSYYEGRYRKLSPIKRIANTKLQAQLCELITGSRSAYSGLVALHARQGMGKSQETIFTLLDLVARQREATAQRPRSVGCMTWCGRMAPGPQPYALKVVMLAGDDLRGLLRRFCHLAESSPDHAIGSVYEAIALRLQKSRTRLVLVIDQALDAFQASVCADQILLRRLAKTTPGFQRIVALVRTEAAARELAKVNQDSTLMWRPQQADIDSWHRFFGIQPSGHWRFYWDEQETEHAVRVWINEVMRARSPVERDRVHAATLERAKHEMRYLPDMQRMDLPWLYYPSALEIALQTTLGDCGMLHEYYHFSQRKAEAICLPLPW